MKSTRTACAAAVIAACSLIAGVAHAAPVNLGVTAGTLDFDPSGAPTVGAFASLTLNGQPQLTRATLDPFTIIDARGTSAGWTVSLAISDLVNGADTLSSTNLSLDAATVIDSSTGAPAASVFGLAVGSFVSGVPTAIVTASAAESSNGTFLVSPKIIKLVVPADALAGTYTAVATLTVS